MTYLTRDAILGADDLPTAVVDVPEWGGEVRLVGLTGEQRDDYEASLLRFRGKSREMNLANARAKLCALSIVDAEGKRVFTDDDVKALGRKSGRVLDRLFDWARKLSGLSEQDVEELTKNSESGPSAASGSS